MSVVEVSNESLPELRRIAVSDLAFFLLVCVYLMVFGIVTYFKTIPSSRIFRFLQKPEWMAVISLPLISVPFAVHLPSDIFYFLILTTLLLPLLFFPV